LKLVLILGGLVATIAAVAFSLLVFAAPKPIIVIHGENLVSVGPLDILNTLFTAWVCIALLLILCFVAVRKMSMVPSGFYNFFEAIIEGIYNFVTGLAGEKNGRRFFPLIATFFLYIAFANWMGLTPIFNSIGAYVELHAEEDAWHSEAIVFTETGGLSLVMPKAEFVELDDSACPAGDDEGYDCRHHVIDDAAAEYASGEGEKLGVLFPYLRGINTDLMTTLSFAIMSAIFVEYWGISSQGFFRYMSRFFTIKNPIAFFVGILEFIAELARLVSFSARLFGNMLAGEILLFVMTFLVGMAAPILVVFYGLEVFVGAIQAFVFGTLTLVFAMLAVTSHDDHDHEGTHDDEHSPLIHEDQARHAEAAH
jgi:F-type H+-transporting ATPase subunit a